MSSRESFLETLWPSGAPGYLCIWVLPDRTSLWFDDLRAAQEEGLSRALAFDVYFSVGAFGAVPEKGRGKAEQVVAVPGIWADLDVGGKGFADQEAVEHFLAELPRQPTVLVSSGNGIHAYWLYREPWELESAAERAEHLRLARGWIAHLRSRSGVKVDGVFDLARVLRLPGTVNHKDGGMRPVEVLRSGGPRYNPSDFEPWRSRERPAAAKDEPKVAGSLRLDPAAEPPFEKFTALSDMEPKFLASWQRRRSDLEDTSASGYDLSLATMAFLAGWEEQEIVDLLIAARRQRGDDLKLRESYYRPTLKRAADQGRLVQTSEKVSEALEGRGEISEETRRFILEKVRVLTGLPIARFLVYGETEPRFDVVLEDGTNVPLGGGAALLNWNTWMLRALQHGLKVKPKPKEQFLWMLNALRAIQEKHTSEDVSETVIFEGWVEDYTAGSTLDLTGASGPELCEVLQTGRPFRRNGSLHLRLGELATFVQLVKKRSMTEAQLLRLLRMTGYQSRPVAARDRGGRIFMQRYWVCGDDGAV